MAGMGGPNRGSVTVPGTNLAGLSRHDLTCYRLRTAISGLNLIASMTLLENVKLRTLFGGVDRRLREQIAKESLQRLGMDDCM
jgi:predicted ABC-type transport system involved in lysophospholipase L1 biosynthesis ATPase subunit